MMSEAAQDKPEFWNRRTYCVITGASQGIGCEIAIQFAQNVANESTFLLLARNLDNLNETKKQMEAANSNVNVFAHSYNFYEPVGSELNKIMQESLEMFQKRPEDFDLYIIVHNAGSLGDASELTHNMTNLEKLTNYFSLNFFSVCILNSEFLKLFDGGKREIELSPVKKQGEICIINITSLCAIKPFASLGYYCTGKACREMYFAVMAEENKKYTILNYSPGCVLTEMTDILTSSINNEEMRNRYITMRNDHSMLTPVQTVTKLVKVLQDRSFHSGSRVDYYDFKDEC